MKKVVYAIGVLVLLALGSGCAETQEEKILRLISKFESTDDRVRQFAVSELVDIGSPVVDSLIRVLKEHKVAQCRLAAALALGGIGDRRAVEPLTGALREDEAWDVRSQAVWALAKTDKNAIEPIIKALQKDNSKWVRCSAVYTLGEVIGDRRVVEPLIQALKDEDTTVREDAVKSLRKITGQDFGTDYKKWKAWYEKSREK